MTSQGQYGGRSPKPIRKDRVLLVLLILAAAITIPLLVRTGGRDSADRGGLDVLSDGQSVGRIGGETTAAVATSPDVQTVVDQILSGSGSTAAAAATPSTAAPSSSSPANTASSPASSSTAAASGTSSKATILTYTAKVGDTAQRAASALGVSVRDLRASNEIVESGTIETGRVLYASKDGLVHTIKSGQTLSDISATYGVSVNAIVAANGITAASTIFAGSRLVIPGASSAYWDNVTRLARGSATLFIWPLEGEVVSTYGWRNHPVIDMYHHHDGIDFDVPEGTTVYASAAGKVYYYGEQPGYGNVLILEHATNYYTLYGHLSASLVRVGQFVERGQRVASTGNTGISSGPHLHFELRNGEFPIDPLQVLPVP